MLDDEDVQECTGPMPSPPGPVAQEHAWLAKKGDVAGKKARRSEKELAQILQKVDHVLREFE